MSAQSGYILAVDGGQTHSLAILAAADGRVLGAGKGGPANHFLETGGEKRFDRSMRECIVSAFKQAGLPVQPVAAAYYSLTGVHEKMNLIVHRIAPSGQQVIAADKAAALAGATRHRPAVLVLAGTGAIAYGMDAFGREETTGGWGYVMGDEGSAAWIAPWALSAATRAEDGRGLDTMLRQMIPQHFHLNSLRDLHFLIYTQKLDRVELAGIASVVGESAKAGDSVAQAILAEAGHCLGDAALTVIRKLDPGASPVTITTAGGVFKAGEAVLVPMMQRIQETHPLAYYAPPEFPPVIGALLLALQSIGIVPSPEIIENVHSTEAIWSARK